MKPLYRTYFKKWLFAALLLAGTTACEDNIENPTPTTPEEEGVQVELSFGFADEDDGYTASKQADTRSGKTTQSGAFSAELTPTVKTRETGTQTEDFKPAGLYNLYVLQYSGENLKKSQAFTANVGSKLSVTLDALDDCRLVVVAFGKDNTVPTIPKTFSEFQKLTMPSTLFDGTTILTSGATQEQMNKMPYILYLPHVKVTQDGKLQSPDGAYDTRLLLKRLATKLTVNWTFSDDLKNKGYALKEVKLCQIPADFRLLPVEEDTKWGTTYPSVVSEFVDVYRLTVKADLNAGTKTVWIPANARGTSAKATSDRYRTKENAPEAASYVELVVDNSPTKERLYYRAYLGGKTSTDFNLYENTDYNWTLNIKSANYREDNRIQLLDQTPVVSNNLVETANCFMMQPGTNISFNPYKHEAGTNGWNQYLTSGGTTITNPISYVKVLWQTKDAGTSGDLVMGYIVDKDNHKNLVNATNLNNINDARVHIKVPVTNGGNAVIAAYNSGNKIVWSWHIWISDYIPVRVDASKITDATRQAAIESAQAATQGGAVQAYGGVSWTASDGAFYKCVIMDRHLGATRAGIQDNLLDRVRTFGLLYQGGRKDPFFSTADGTKNEVKTIYDGYGQPVGIERDHTNTNTQTGGSLHTRQKLTENPMTYYAPGQGAPLSNETSWGNQQKGIDDPCPAGWKVPSNMYATKGNKYALLAGVGTTDPSGVLSEKGISANDNIKYWNCVSLSSMKGSNNPSVSGTTTPGAGFLYSGSSAEVTLDSKNSIFFPGVALREGKDGSYREETNNNALFLWSSTKDSGTGYRYIFQIQSGVFALHYIGETFGFSVRCVQNSEQP